MNDRGWWWKYESLIGSLARASVPSRPSYDTFLGTTVPNTIPKTGIYRLSAPKEPKIDFTMENLSSSSPKKKYTWPRFSNVSHCSARLWQRICISVNSSKPMSQSTRHSAISSTCCQGGKVGFFVRWVGLILANCIQKHTRGTNKIPQKQHMFNKKNLPKIHPSLPPKPTPPPEIFPNVHHLFSLRLVSGASCASLMACSAACWASTAASCFLKASAPRRCRRSWASERRAWAAWRKSCNCSKRSCSAWFV